MNRNAFVLLLNHFHPDFGAIIIYLIPFALTSRYIIHDTQCIACTQRTIVWQQHSVLSKHCQISSDSLEDISPSQ